MTGNPPRWYKITRKSDSREIWRRTKGEVVKRKSKKGGKGKSGGGGSG